MNVGDQERRFVEPGGEPEEAEVSLTPPVSQPASPITAVVERHRAELTRVKGVYGVSEGRTAIGDDAIRVDVESESVGEQLPSELEGYPVEVVVVPGGFEALPARD